MVCVVSLLLYLGLVLTTSFLNLFFFYVLLFNILDRMDYLEIFYHHSAALQCSYSRHVSTLEDHITYYSRRKPFTTYRRELPLLNSTTIWDSRLSMMNTTDET